jgi:mannosyltransferase
MSRVDGDVQQGLREGSSEARAGEVGRLGGRLSRAAFVRQPRLLTWVTGLIVFGVALGFDLYRLGAPSIWFDEAFSVELARQPLPVMWHIIWGPEPNMELYYLFLHGWLGLTGLFGWLPTEFVVRLPSTIFAALASVMVYLLGRRYMGMAAGIAGAGLFSLSFPQLTYAQQTRAYSLQLLLLCIAWFALFAILSQEKNARRWWACFILASTLAIYAQLFSALILFSQLVAFAGLLVLPGSWRLRARRNFIGFLVSLGVTGVLCIPMWLVSLHGAKTNWLPVPHLHDILYLFEFITTNSKTYMLLLFIFCATAAGIALLSSTKDFKPLFRSFTFSYKSEQAEAQLQEYIPLVFSLVCWLVVPIALSYVISQGPIRLFSTRYLVTILPPLFLLAGVGIGALRWRSAQAALILGMLLLALYYVPVYYRSAQVEDWNSTVHWLQQRYQPGDGLVCFDNDVEQGCQVSVQYYLDAYPTGAQFTSDAPGAFSWTSFGPANPASGTFAAVDPAALATFAAHHPRMFYILGRFPDNATAAKAQAAQNWLDSHYHLLGRITTRTVTISLYATGG